MKDIVMLSRETRQKWNALSQKQRDRAMDIMLYHAERTERDELCEAWYKNAIDEVC